MRILLMPTSSVHNKEVFEILKCNIYISWYKFINKTHVNPTLQTCSVRNEEVHFSCAWSDHELTVLQESWRPWSVHFSPESQSVKWGSMHLSCSPSLTTVQWWVMWCATRSLRAARLPWCKVCIHTICFYTLWVIVENLTMCEVTLGGMQYVTL